jgi:hypothetical protein
MTTTPRLGITLPDDSTNATTQFFIDRYNEIDANAARKLDLDNVNINKPNKTSADINYYVSTTGSDSNDGLTAGTAFRTIQHALDSIPDIVLHHITINIADGTYRENVLFQYHIGTNIITLAGSPNAILYGYLKAVGIIGIAFELGTITIKSYDNSDTTLHITSCTNVNLNGTTIDGNSKGVHGIYAVNSIVTVNNYYLRNVTGGICIFAFTNTQLLLDTCKGSSGNTGTGICSDASIVRRNGTMHSTSGTATSTVRGGQIY